MNGWTNLPEVQYGLHPGIVQKFTPQGMQPRLSITWGATHLKSHRVHSGQILNAFDGIFFLLVYE